MINKMEEIRNQSRIRSCCEMKDENKNGIEFEKIVKFLNDQKAVMDYAALN